MSKRSLSDVARDLIARARAWRKNDAVEIKLTGPVDAAVYADALAAAARLSLQIGYTAEYINSAIGPMKPDYEYKIGSLVCYDHLTALEHQTALADEGMPTEILRRVVGHWKRYREGA